MIIDALLFVIVTIISSVFYLLPTVTLSSIPVIGDTITEILTTIVTTWNSFEATFPYATTAWHIFLMLITFEISMLIAKFFLGNRIPANTN